MGEHRRVLRDVTEPRVPLVGLVAKLAQIPDGISRLRFVENLDRKTTKSSAITVNN